MRIEGYNPQLDRVASLELDGTHVVSVASTPIDESPSGVVPVVSRGWLDLQVNGLNGIAFNSAVLSPDQVEAVTRQLWSVGVTHYCPTLITDSLDRLARSLAVISRACGDERVGRSVVGIHLEGPYLSPQDGPRGAHPLAHVRRPDWDEFCRLQEAAGGRVCLMTLAPELDGAVPFIERLVTAGVRVAIGHTAASAEEIDAAVSAGACMSTHLGNAAHDQLQRHRNYVYAQLADDRLWASLIVDGHHLPPGLVKIFVRAKRADRVILVSDAMHWAGMAPGVYPWGHREIEVRNDGCIGVVGEPRLAGSGLTLDRGVGNFVQYCGLPLGDAIRAVTVHPWCVMGGSKLTTVPSAGDDATITQFDWDTKSNRVHVRQTIVAGECVYRAG